jgi:apolipoprotein D and lipocalin family protein
MRFAILALVTLSLVCASKAAWQDGFPACLGWPLIKGTLQSYAAPIDITRYQGVWYEQTRIPQLFQKGLCAKAIYGPVANEPEQISVVNMGEDPDHPGEEISGAATLQHNDSTTSKFNLKFNFFARGQYWILELEDDYSVVLIGEPCRMALWVLSREKHLSADKVQAYLKIAREKHGYTNTDKMVFRKDSC